MLQRVLVVEHVAACPNGAAMLFTSAKVAQYAMLPQGAPERASRVNDMVETMDKLGFGNCSNEYECCEEKAPKRDRCEKIWQDSIVSL